MIYIVYGDDNINIQNFIKFHKKQYRAENVYEIKDSENIKSEMVDMIESHSLFGANKLILTYPKSVKDLNFDQKKLAEWNGNKSIEIIIDGTKLQKSTKEYKFLKKHSKVQEFKLPQDYKFFRITDSLFINDDKGRALKEISEIKEAENDIFLFINSMHTSLRNYISSQFNNETLNSLHPYVRSKLKSYKKLEPENIYKLYEALFKLDVKLKSSNQEAASLMQDFVLYYF